MPPFVPTTHTVPGPGPGVQLGGSRLPKIKAFLPGKKTEGDIKPD